MANGNELKNQYTQTNPDSLEGQVNAGVPSKQAQSFIEGVVGIGWSMLGGGLAQEFDNPNLMAAAEKAGQGVISALKDDWHQQQYKNFQSTHGRRYQDGLKAAQQMHTIASTTQMAPDGPSGQDEPFYPEVDADGNFTGNRVFLSDTTAAVQHLMSNNERFYTKTHELSSGFMDAAGSFSGNPLIAGAVERNIQFWQQQQEQMTKGREEAMGHAQAMQQFEAQGAQRDAALAEDNAMVKTFLQNADADTLNKLYEEHSDLMDKKGNLNKDIGQIDVSNRLVPTIKAMQAEKALSLSQEATRADIDQSRSIAAKNRALASKTLLAADKPKVSDHSTAYSLYAGISNLPEHEVTINKAIRTQTPVIAGIVDRTLKIDANESIAPEQRRSDVVKMLKDRNIPSEMHDYVIAQAGKIQALKKQAKSSGENNDDQIQAVIDSTASAVVNSKNDELQIDTFVNIAVSPSDQGKEVRDMLIEAAEEEFGKAEVKRIKKRTGGRDDTRKFLTAITKRLFEEAPGILPQPRGTPPAPVRPQAKKRVDRKAARLAHRRSQRRGMGTDKTVSDLLPSGTGAAHQRIQEQRAVEQPTTMPPRVKYPK